MFKCGICDKVFESVNDCSLHFLECILSSGSEKHKTNIKKIVEFCKKKEKDIEEEKLKSAKYHCDIIKKAYDSVEKENYGDIKRKKPIHPGEVAHSLLIELGYKSYTIPNEIHIHNASCDLELDYKFLDMLLKGKKEVDYVIAYRLSKVIKGTDIRFWMDLQERYDSYKGETK